MVAQYFSIIIQKLSSWYISCAFAKAAGAKLRMIGEDFINNAENLVTNGYNMKCLFILDVLGNALLLNVKPMLHFYTPERYQKAR